MKPTKTDDGPESLWIAQHPQEVYRYEGEWIAVVGQRIVAHGRQLRDVVRAAEPHGQPLLKYVEPAGFVAYGIFFKL